MSGTVNKVILVGNLGKDPEIRLLDNGVKLARFPIATSETFTDKTSGERRKITDWHNVVLWRGLADIAEKYLSKGQKIYVEGKLKTRNWQDETGATRYAVEVVGENMTMLSSRAENEMDKSRPDFTSGELPDKPNPLSSDLMEDEDDELPF